MATLRTVLRAIASSRIAFSRVSRLASPAAPLVLLFALASVPPARAEDKEAPAPWGFNGTFGTGGAGGDFGTLFREPVSWEFNFFHQRGPWRFGIGYSFESFKMKDPYQDELEWGYQQFYLSGTRMFNMKGSVRPFIQVRGGLARLRPRSELFKMNPLPEDWEKGMATQKASDGFGVSVIPGLEFKLSRAAFLDASVSFNYFSVSDYDLSPVGLPPTGSGTAWQGRLGVTWLPNGEQQGKGDEGGPRDAWGVKRSYGWAAGEVLAINSVAGIFAQYVRNVDWSETSPRSWWDNIQYGFAYDSDDFKTNQWVHPFNGAAYYNSSRANGISFWPSAGFALAGAFQWECCGETQRMSFNDMFATTIGGIALGEAQYRLSSEILNNQSQGKGRLWREIGALFVDPIRGFNRFVSGDAKKQADNPVDPMDWRPPNGRTFLAIGARSIGEGSSITHNTQTYATVLLNHSYGNVFDATRRKPFDFIDFVGEVNFGEKTSLGNVQIRGNLASWPLGSAKDHVLALVQHFDYMNNTAYEFGGQSVGAALSSRFRLSNRVGLRTRLDADGILLGGINADYSKLADVPNRENLRNYDYGPGLGAAARVDLVLSGHPILSALYRFAWISTSNGSTFVYGTYGFDANHYIQGAGARLMIPIKGSFGVGGDFYVFLRDSDYTLVDSATGRERIQSIQQRNPQLRVYVAMSR
jgi:hypothetical protein